MIYEAEGRWDRWRLMAVSRGDVRWGPAPFKGSPAYRPWVVVSTDAHPFAGEECIAVALTTTAHEEAIAVPDDAWTQGGSERQPYASPWYVTTIKIPTFDRMQGSLVSSFVDHVSETLHEYVPVRA